MLMLRKMLASSKYYPGQEVNKDAEDVEDANAEEDADKYNPGQEVNEDVEDIDVDNVPGQEVDKDIEDVVVAPATFSC